MSSDDIYDDLDYVNGTIIIVTDDIDENTVLSGMFALNGFKCFKTASAEEALDVLDRYIDRVDAMLIDGKIAQDRGAMIIVKSKRKKVDIKIVVVANNDNAKTRVLDYGADEFTLKPTSPEILISKVLTQLSHRHRNR